MTVEPIKRADPELVKALARDARGLLDDLAFSTAVRALHAQWYGELMDPSITREKEGELVAKLRTLESLPRMLEHFLTSQIMQQRGSNGRGA